MSRTQTWIFFPLAANGRRKPKLSSRNLFLIQSQTTYLYLSMITFQLPPGREVPHIADLLVDVTPSGVHVESLHLSSTDTQCG